MTSFNPWTCSVSKEIKTQGQRYFLHVLYEKYFKCLSSKITNDAGCTLEIKSRIAMAKAAFKMEKKLFTRKLD
jgi:hypothetical protein